MQRKNALLKLISISSTTGERWCLSEAASGLFAFAPVLLKYNDVFTHFSLQSLHIVHYNVQSLCPIAWLSLTWGKLRYTRKTHILWTRYILCFTSDYFGSIYKVSKALVLPDITKILIRFLEFVSVEVFIK